MISELLPAGRTAPTANTTGSTASKRSPHDPSPTLSEPHSCTALATLAEASSHSTAGGLQVEGGRELEDGGAVDGVGDHSARHGQLLHHPLQLRQHFLAPAHTRTPLVGFPTQQHTTRPVRFPT
eukprot:3731101-Rhodomonas_salina.5